MSAIEPRALAAVVAAAHLLTAARRGAQAQPRAASSWALASRLAAASEPAAVRALAQASSRWSIGGRLGD